MPNLGPHIDDVVVLRSDFYSVRPLGRDDELSLVFRRRERLVVGVAKTAWVIAFAYEQWEQAWHKDGLPTPSFEWESIAAFRPNDPIIIIRTADGAIQALMQIRENCVVPCPLGQRRPLVYVSFLEVAPWNQLRVKGRRYRGLGQLLLRLACQRSQQLGHSGRIGLHALASAEPFYRKLGFDVPICPNEYNELYFELSEAKAQLLLSQ
jgi:hypothetical protein